MLAGCASIAPPQPPSLELPKPPTDLRATRKGARVTLTWTLPTLTTDRQTIRNLGPTRICRGPADLKQCGIPVGETTTPVSLAARDSSKPKGSYTDTLPDEMLSGNPSAFVSYAVEVLNSGGRGAGLSNQSRVSLVRTLPPPQDFQASVTGMGDCPLLDGRCSATARSRYSVHLSRVSESRRQPAPDRCRRDILH